MRFLTDLFLLFLELFSLLGGAILFERFLILNLLVEIWRPMFQHISFSNCI
jgi:hypothetical protein